MDIAKIVAELRAERARLDGIIVALERLGVNGRVPAEPKRRGRKFMDKAGRQEVSERMKRYWAGRRQNYAGAQTTPLQQSQAIAATETGVAP